MKYIIFIPFILLALAASSQVSSQQNGAQFFAQFTYQESLTEQQVLEFEGNLQQNPNILMVRVDRNTNGVFLVTQNLASFEENSVVSWLSTSFEVIECYREGLYRVDSVIPFNDNFCSIAE